MTKVNVSATVGMSVTGEEMSATVGECPQQWGEMCCKKLKTRESHSQLNSEDTWNNMSKAH